MGIVQLQLMELQSWCLEVGKEKRREFIVIFNFHGQ